jgi:nicotinamidase-related amidase
MLNTYRHPDAGRLASNTAEIIEPLANLISRARSDKNIDVVCVNDNYGDFTADFAEIVRSARNGANPDLVEPLVPQPDCLTLTKVRHSAFYATALDYLLRRLETTRIVLTGQVTEQCILYSALDGYVRHFDVVVPPDAVASIDPELGDAALKMMGRNMRAELRPAAACLC